MSEMWTQRTESTMDIAISLQDQEFFGKQSDSGGGIGGWCGPRSQELKATSGSWKMQTNKQDVFL